MTFPNDTESLFPTINWRSRVDFCEPGKTSGNIRPLPLDSDTGG